MYRIRTASGSLLDSETTKNALIRYIRKPAKQLLSELSLDKTTYCRPQIKAHEGLGFETSIFNDASGDSHNEAKDTQ